MSICILPSSGYASGHVRLIDGTLRYCSEQHFFSPHLFLTNMVSVKSFSDFGFDGTELCLKDSHYL